MATDPASTKTHSPMLRPTLRPPLSARFVILFDPLSQLIYSLARSNPTFSVARFALLTSTAARHRTSRVSSRTSWTTLRSRSASRQAWKAPSSSTLLLPFSKASSHRPPITRSSSPTRPPSLHPSEATNMFQSKPWNLVTIAPSKAGPAALYVYNPRHQYYAVNKFPARRLKNTSNSSTPPPISRPGPKMLLLSSRA